MDVRRASVIKNGEESIGNRTAVKVVKNKMAPPFAKVEFDLMYNEGISTEGDILDLASAKSLIDKSGSWYSYNGERIGQGRDAAKQFLRDNPKITEVLRTKVLELHGIGKGAMVAKAAAAPEAEAADKKPKKSH